MKNATKNSENKKQKVSSSFFNGAQYIINPNNTLKKSEVFLAESIYLATFIGVILLSIIIG